MPDPEITLNHTHVLYDNFVLANEIEDQYNSHLNLVRFCTIDNDLVGTAGMTKKIHVYRATDGTQKLLMGEGNTKNIEVSYAPEEYVIQLAQNRFPYYDEEVMTDPLVLTTGIRHMATDMFNTVNDDVFAEFNKAQLRVYTGANGATNKQFDFGSFVDAVALLNLESIENIEVFAFVTPKEMANLRKTLKEDLKYVEGFIRTGYVGTVGGVNIYTKKDAVDGEIIVATKEAVTLFNKRGVEVEQEREPNLRLNEVYARKYYLTALTDATKVVKMIRGEEPEYTLTIEETNDVEITVVIKQGDTTITAEQDGTYKLTNGTYDYTISATGYVAQTGKVVIYDDDKTLKITMVASGG